MLGLLELVLFGWIHPLTRRGLVEVGHHVVAHGGAVLHLVLLVCCGVVNFVLGLFCFVIFTIRRDIHVITFLFHLRPSFISNKFIFRVFFEECLRRWGSDCNLIILALI